MLPCRHDLERDELELRLGAQVQLLLSSGNSNFDGRRQQGETHQHKHQPGDLAGILHRANAGRAPLYLAVGPWPAHFVVLSVWIPLPWIGHLLGPNSGSAHFFAETRMNAGENAHSSGSSEAVTLAVFGDF